MCGAMSQSYRALGRPLCQATGPACQYCLWCAPTRPHALLALLAKMLVPRATAPLGFVRLVRERPSCTGAKSGHPRRTRRRMAQGEDVARCGACPGSSSQRREHRSAEQRKAGHWAGRRGRAARARKVRGAYIGCLSNSRRGEPICQTRCDLELRNPLLRHGQSYAF